MTQDITIKNNTNLVNPQQQAVRGFEAGVSNDDLIMPRAKLIQPSSTEIMEGIPGVGIGNIINSLTKETMPEDFIPIFFFKNYMRFNPRKQDDPNFLPEYQPGALIWRTNDGNDPRVLKEAQFGKNDELPIAMTCMNFFAYFVGTSIPVVISFAKTSYKTGKTLLSFSRFSGKDMFANKYKLGVKKETKNGNTYFIFTVTQNGFATPEEYAQCENLWKVYSPKAQEIIVHDIEAEGKDPEPTDGMDTDKAPF